MNQNNLKSGPISQADLLKGLAKAKKVMNKIDAGDFTRGNIDESLIVNENYDNIVEEYKEDETNNASNIDRINKTKLPDAIKKAMIESPIPQISLNDSIDMNFVKNAKRLMEQDEKVSVQSQSKMNFRQPKPTTSNDSDLIRILTPIIENVIRKTLDEIVDRKLNQILTAQQTQTINEGLMIKVGNSIFKGKLTGVKKAN